MTVELELHFCPSMNIPHTISRGLNMSRSRRALYLKAALVELLLVRSCLIVSNLCRTRLARVNDIVATNTRAKTVERKQSRLIKLLRNL